MIGCRGSHIAQSPAKSPSKSVNGTSARYLSAKRARLSCPSDRIYGRQVAPHVWKGIQSVACHGQNITRTHSKITFLAAIIHPLPIDGKAQTRFHTVKV